MSIFSIHKLTPLDAVDYRNVRLHGLLNDPVAFNGCYEEEKHLSIADYANRIPEAPDLSAIFGAFSAETHALVGIVGLHVSSVAKLRHKGTLWGMYTMPEARGYGVGRRLMDHLLAYAREQTPIEQVQLVVTESNTATKEWYERCGFTLYGIERNSVKFGGQYEHDELRVLWLYSQLTD